MKKENIPFLKNLNYKYRIGMRAIKTALAVTIGLYVSQLLKINSPIFVSIASVSTMKASLYESLSDTKKRLFTCIFGVILGYLSSKISVPRYFEPVIAGLGILIIIYILVVFDMKKMTQLSCIVFVASFASESKLIYAVNRIIGTVIGVGVGVMVNYFISSPNVYRQFIESVKKSYRSANRAFKALIVDNELDFSEFNADYKKTTEFYDLLKKEVKTPFINGIDISDEKKMMSILDSISVRFEIIKNFKGENLNENVVTKLNKRYNVDKKSTDSLSESERVDNYHIESILKYFDDLNILIGGK